MQPSLKFFSRSSFDSATQTLPMAELRPIPVPRRRTSPTTWTRIILVEPALATGTPAVRTTRSPALMRSLSRAAKIALSTTASVSFASLPVTAWTPQLSCKRRTMASCGDTATIGQAGRNLEIIWAVPPRSVEAMIAAAWRSLAILTTALPMDSVVVADSASTSS